MKLLKTMYLCTYEHDHHLNDKICPLVKQPSTTNKSKPDIYQFSGEVSDGGGGRTKFLAQARYFFCYLGSLSSWDLGFVFFPPEWFYILWHSAMEPGSRCVITHTKGQVGHSLSPVSPSSRFRPVWEVFFEPCAKGMVLRMESPLAPLCTSCAASVRQVLFVLCWPLYLTRSSSEGETGPAHLPFNSGTGGVKYRHPSGGWFPLCGVGVWMAHHLTRSVLNKKRLILPPLLSPHNTIN